MMGVRHGSEVGEPKALTEHPPHDTQGAGARKRARGNQRCVRRLEAVDQQHFRILEISGCRA